MGGQLITLPDRQYNVKLMKEAILSGARQHKACEVIGLSVRTLQRWQADGGVVEDKRPIAIRPAPANKLSEDERRAIVAICNADEFATFPPSQIVPILADRDEYIGSESSFYRILKSEGMLHHRGKAKARSGHKMPTSHTANTANEVWSWDIFYLPTMVIEQHYYLCMIEDIYSRKVVGWEVHHNEAGERQQSCWNELCGLRNVESKI